MKKQIGLTLVAMLTIGVLAFAAASSFTHSVAAQRGNGQSNNGCGIVDNSQLATALAKAGNPPGQEVKGMTPAGGGAPGAVGAASSAAASGCSQGH